MKMFKIKNKKRGFSLVELMIVMAIIALLSVVLIPKIGFAPNKAKESGVITDFHSFEIALEGFKIAKGRLPNPKEFQDTLKKDFTFALVQAKVREEEGQKFLTIRVETDEKSPFDCPYGITFTNIYNGSEEVGHDFDLEADKEVLENIEDIESVIIDCINSNTNPIIYVK